MLSPCLWIAVRPIGLANGTLAAAIATSLHPPSPVLTPRPENDSSFDRGMMSSVYGSGSGYGKKRGSDANEEAGAKRSRDATGSNARGLDEVRW